MMKNKVIMTYLNVQKANEKSFFGKNMTFKNLFQYILTKVSDGFELGICGSQDQCPRPMSYDDIRESRPI